MKMNRIALIAGIFMAIAATDSLISVHWIHAKSLTCKCNVQYLISPKSYQSGHNSFVGHITDTELYKTVDVNGKCISRGVPDFWNCKMWGPKPGEKDRAARLCRERFERDFIDAAIAEARGRMIDEWPDLGDDLKSGDAILKLDPWWGDCYE